MADSLDIALNVIDRATAPAKGVISVLKDLKKNLDLVKTAEDNVAKAQSALNNFSLDNTKFKSRDAALKEQQKLIDNVAKAQKGLGGATDKLDGSKASAVGNAISGIGEAATAAGEAVVAAGAAIGVAFVGAVVGIGALAIGVGNASYKVNGLEKQFSLMSQGASDGKAEVDALLKSVKETSQPLDAVTKGFGELKQSGLSTEDAQVFNTISLNLNAINGDGAKFLNIIKDITKEGTLSQQKFQDLAEQFGGTDKVSAALAKNLGVSTKQVQKLVSTGKGIKLTPDVLQAVKDLGKGVDGAASATTPLIDRLQSIAQTKILDFAKNQNFINFDAIPKLFESILDNPAVKGFGDAIGAGITQIAQLFYDNGPAIDKFFGAIVDSVKIAIPVIFKIAAAITEFALGALPYVTAAIKLVTDNMGAFKTVIEVVAIAVGVVAALFVGSFAAIIAAAALLAAGLSAAFDLITDGIAYVIGVVVGFVDTIVSNFEAAGGGILGVFAAIVSGITYFPATLFAIVSTAFLNVFAFLTGLPASFVTLGTSIIDGLVQGILAAPGRLIGAITGVAASIKGAFKSALGIASPSKVFAELGGFVAEGAQVGIEDNSTGVQSAAAGLIDPNGLAASASSSPSPASASAGGGSNVGGITINVSGASGDPQAIADAVKDSLLELFTKLNLQGGLS